MLAPALIVLLTTGLGYFLVSQTIGRAFIDFSESAFEHLDPVTLQLLAGYYERTGTWSGLSRLLGGGPQRQFPAVESGPTRRAFCRNHAGQACHRHDPGPEFARVPSLDDARQNREWTRIHANGNGLWSNGQFRDGQWPGGIFRRPTPCPDWCSFASIRGS